MFRQVEELKKERYIESKDLSLDEWLQMLEKPPRKVVFVDYQFPSDRHRKEYIDGIDKRSDAEVISLIRRFLIPSSSLGVDEHILDDFFRAAKENQDRYRKMAEREFIKRLIRSVNPKNPPPWEGITWVLDLLPHFPKQALEGLNAYLMAHAQWLPDGRFAGLSHSAELIRAKFIGVPESTQEKLEILSSVSSRQFECLVERLYAHFGYDTELTSPRSDGGRDVIARRNAPARKEELRVECKRHTKPIGVEQARRLLGVVSSEKATKGVLASTASFTRGARNFAKSNPRIELISGPEFVLLMNEHLGPRWPAHLERLVAESLRVNEDTALPDRVLDKAGGSVARICQAGPRTVLEGIPYLVVLFFDIQLPFLYI